VTGLARTSRGDALAGKLAAMTHIDPEPPDTSDRYLEV
jgi:hypothetical protein